jgi:hypothetical protein
MNYHLLIALIVVMNLCCGGFIGFMSGSPIPVTGWEEHRICGRLLINTLKHVCDHHYAQPTRGSVFTFSI